MASNIKNSDIYNGKLNFVLIASSTEYNSEEVQIHFVWIFLQETLWRVSEETNKTRSHVYGWRRHRNNFKRRQSYNYKKLNTTFLFYRPLYFLQSLLFVVTNYRSVSWAITLSMTDCCPNFNTLNDQQGKM